MTDTSWTAHFSGLGQLPPSVQEQLVSKSRVVSIAKGQVVFAPDSVPDHLLMLTEGTVRVSQTSESGREIVLYRAESGQSCILTTAFLMLRDATAAEGVAEADVKAVAIPRSLFDDLVSTSPEFRDFVFAAFAQRISDLLQVIDDVAFGRIDMRLAERLVALADDGNVVAATHQKLATELGTAREVISRQLTEFQRRGWIAQSRGRIQLTDSVSLSQLARAE